MPLSKHLYNIEDLCAFFLFSLEHHDMSSAYAVVKELQESLEHDTLESLLVFAWLLTEPSKDFTLQRWSAIINKRYDIFISTFQSTEITAFIVVDNVVSEPNISESELTIVRKSLRHKQVWRAYLQSAHLCKGGATLSFLHCLGLSDESYTLLHNFRHSMALRILHHALYILAYPTMLFDPPSTKSIPSVEIIINTEAILKWGLTPKSAEYLVGAPTFIYDTSPYWTQQREVYGIQPNFVFHSDKLCDEFYAKNFPNDIPDEWAEEERIKRVGSPLKTNPEQVPKEWQKTLLSIVRS